MPQVISFIFATYYCYFNTCPPSLALINVFPIFVKVSERCVQIIYFHISDWKKVLVRIVGMCAKMKDLFGLLADRGLNKVTVN